MKVHDIFSAISRDFTNYQNTVTHVFSTYRTNISAAKTEVAQYKDEQNEFAKRKAAELAVARAAIRDADKTLCDSLTLFHIPKLKAAVAEYLTEKPIGNIMNTLREYLDFGLTMTVDEVKALLPETLGVYRALRALASVAKDSGISVTLPDVSTFLEDVKALEKLANAPIQWSPSEYVGEAAEIFGKVWVRNPETGATIYEWGNMDAASAIAASHAFNQIAKHLDERAAAWETTFVPQVEEFEDEDEQTALEQWAKAEHANLNQIGVASEVIGSE